MITKGKVYQVTVTPEQVRQSVLVILDERIKRADIALPMCKHTKRKHRLLKLIAVMKKIRDDYADVATTNQ